MEWAVLIMLGAIIVYAWASGSLGQMQEQVADLITTEANAQGVDPDLALAVAEQESGGHQSAVSPVGAIGVFQLMPDTAADLGVDPYNVTDNIKGGVAYLKQLSTLFAGNLEAILAAYNWGMGNVQKAMAAYGDDWLSHAPAETQNYVASITGALG